MSNTELGAFISEHKGRFAAGGISWYLGGILFAAGFVGMGREILAGNWVNIPFFLLVCGCAGLWLFYNFTRWKQKITLYSDGFVWTRVVRKPVVVRWADVASVQVTRRSSRQAMHLKGFHVDVDLALRDGSHVVVTNDMDGVETIASYASTPAEPSGPPPASPWGAPSS
jgi:hypothetical protein